MRRLESDDCDGDDEEESEDCGGVVERIDKRRRRGRREWFVVSIGVPLC